MLPQHYQVNRRRAEDEDDDDNDDEEKRRTIGNRESSFTGSFRTPTASGSPQPPLGVTGVLCDTNSLSIRGRGTLQYTVFRPRYVRMKPPLVCLAGGPYLPWNYLSVLVHLINDRSLVFFDPIGCGQSKRIEDNNKNCSKDRNESLANNSNPVPEMVHDFTQSIQHLNLEHFHLFGHSFGGIVAYEALISKEIPGTCLSLILSSTPANIPQALQEIDELKEILKPEAQSSTMEDLDHAVAHLFAERHECRVRPLPLQLQQSFAMAGFSSSPAGWQVVRDYVAPLPSSDDDGKFKIPLLLLRGEFDFISEESMEPWWNCMENSLSSDGPSPNNIVSVPGVAHYGMLEDEKSYGGILRSFLGQVKEPALKIPTPKAPSTSQQRRSRLPS